MTGKKKVTITGEEFQNFLKGSEDVDKFERQLLKLNEEFGEFLSIKFTPRTVRKHTQIVDMLISFLCFDNILGR